MDTKKLSNVLIKIQKSNSDNEAITALSDFFFECEKELKSVNEFSDRQIEVMSRMFINASISILEDENFSREWIMSHAFQIGMKFHADLKE